MENNLSEERKKVEKKAKVTFKKASSSDKDILSVLSDDKDDLQSHDVQTHKNES